MSKLYNLLFVVLLALVSLGQLQRIQLTKSLAFYVHDMLIVGWLISTFIWKWQSWAKFFTSLKKYTKPWMWGWLLGLVANIAIALVLHFSMTPLLYVGRVVTYLLFGCTLAFTISFPRSQQRLLWTLAGLLIAWFGLLQYFFIPNTRFLWILGWDDHFYRLISTQLDPNFTGILLSITFFLVWSLKFFNQKIKTLISIPLIVSILLTYSRATYLAFIVSLGALLMLKLPKKKQLQALALVFISSAVILLLPKPGGEGVNLLRTYSAKQRLLSSQRAIQSLSTYEWVMGRGLFQPTNINPEPVLNQHAPFPDNLIVFLLVGLGLPGVLMCLFVMGKISIYLLKTDRYLFTAWLAVLIHSQFNHTLFQPFVLLMILGGFASLEAERHR